VWQRQLRRQHWLVHPHHNESTRESAVAQLLKNLAVSSAFASADCSGTLTYCRPAASDCCCSSTNAPASSNDLRLTTDLNPQAASGLLVLVVHLPKTHQFFRLVIQYSISIDLLVVDDSDIITKDFPIYRVSLSKLIYLCHPQMARLENNSGTGSGGYAKATRGGFLCRAAS